GRQGHAPALEGAVEVAGREQLASGRGSQRLDSKRYASRGAQLRGRNAGLVENPWVRACRDGSQRRGVRALRNREDELSRLAPGGPRWSAVLTGNESTGPAVANGMVYVGRKQVFAFDAATGKLRWPSQSVRPGNYGHSVAVAGDTVVDSTSQALDANTGALRW